MVGCGNRYPSFAAGHLRRLKTRYQFAKNLGEIAATLCVIHRNGAHILFPLKKGVLQLNDALGISV
jgi:hypothetical protein